MAEPIAITTTDGLVLEAEHCAAQGSTRAAVVLCHPHPQYGGTMRSLVISALFEALPDAGVECLRFNYRGVENSTGSYADGVGERLDVVAALDTLVASGSASVPLGLIGWSFGADMALATHDARVAGWMGIALPMRFVSDADRDAVAHDPRPKLLALAQHDEFRDAEWVMDATRGWTNTRVEVVAGASHFFVGRTDRLIDLATEFVASLA
jgi:uncharacterized protein